MALGWHSVAKPHFMEFSWLIQKFKLKMHMHAHTYPHTKHKYKK